MDDYAAHARQHLATYGDEHMSAEDLIALIVGGSRSGRAVARGLLEHTGGLEHLARASTHELTAVAGIGPAVATRLVAAFRLAQRTARTAGAAPGICSGADVHLRLAPRLAGLQQEVFLALALDVRNVVLAEIEIPRWSSATHMYWSFCSWPRCRSTPRASSSNG